MNLLIDLPYYENSADLFSYFADDDWSIFLDSGYPSSHSGRYDILSAEPVATIVNQAGITTLTQPSSKQSTSTSPFKVLRDTLKLYQPKKTSTKLPFNGGALGYFSYDLARIIEKLPSISQNEENLPEMAIGIYTWAIVVDHKLKKTYFTGNILKKSPQLTMKRIIRIFQKTEPPSSQSNRNFHVTSKVSSNLTYSEYRQAFNKIKEYIIAGDCYQINLTQRFSASAIGNPWVAYQQLRKLNPAPFSAYINTPFGQILCSSPERFLQVNNKQVETKPIKGTRPRSDNKKEDDRQKKALQNSPKDRSENVMIVDLLRNDLGRVCEIGSVKTPKLFNIESYTTVHHLVSTVSGTLSSNSDAISLLEACFPGGSITGAPKIRAMEIIESLEPHRRGIYCGSIGYIDFNGNMDINIAIRTLIYNQETIRYWVGGGIVYDSDIDDEYQETLDKGKALLKLLNNCRLIDGA